jgi:hypothetical protein
MTEYPKEYLVPLENEPYFQGKIAVYRLKEEFYSEVQIIFKDGQKIYAHVGSFFQFTSEDECLNTSVQKLSNYTNRT